MIEFTITDGILTEAVGDEPVVVIPDGVSEIGRRAFEEYKNLEELTIPESVRVIDDYAFRGKGSIKRINFCGALERIGTRAFQGCISLRELDLSRGVAVIEDEAFYACNLVKQIKLAGLRDVAESAFVGCTSVNDITVLDVCGYASIDGALYKLDSEGKPEVLVQFPIAKVKLNPVIAEGTRAIGRNAFSYSHIICFITIPETVTAIGSEAFLGCANLMSVDILNPDAKIGVFTFDECRSLNEVNRAKKS
ncbi:MAG: leucine-rich repeat domain-containing protein [Ruminococcaceae bacterium]|nr:leucine-rich repeat domain-containing protein [Oscillospiraceae bacterium]